MTSQKKHRYFVRQLDEHSYRPTREVEFEIQIQGDESAAEKCAYVGRDSNVVVAFVEFTAQGPKSLPLDEHGIPLPVIEAARQRRQGFGEYVNEEGEIVRPSFLKPGN